MGTTVEKLNKVLETKESIRTAINSKGGTLTESDTFSSYVTAIDNIQTGSKNEPITITENGVYTAPEGIGYSPVNVNVASEGNPMQEYVNNNGGDGIPSCKYLFYNYKGTSLDSILKSLDFSKVTNMVSMFHSCSKLTTIPQIDTSKVTNMSSMFYEGYRLTSIPQLNTSNVTNMNSMFYSCSNLTSIPLLDTSNVTNMNSMFYSCSTLTSIPLLDTSSVTNMDYMFERCSKITTIPQFDTSKVTNMNNMFNNCPNLTTIPQLDTSSVTNMGSMFQSCPNLTTIPQFDTSKVTNMDYMFYNCRELKEIHMTGMKINFDISSSTKFTESALVEILNNLATVTSTQTLTMGSTNLAKLTDEEKAIATNKGWTLA